MPCMHYQDPLPPGHDAGITALPTAELGTISSCLVCCEHVGCCSHNWTAPGQRLMQVTGSLTCTGKINAMQLRDQCTPLPWVSWVQALLDLQPGPRQPSPCHPWLWQACPWPPPCLPSRQLLLLWQAWLLCRPCRPSPWLPWAWLAPGLRLQRLTQLPWRALPWPLRPWGLPWASCWPAGASKSRCQGINKQVDTDDDIEIAATSGYHLGQSRAHCRHVQVVQGSVSPSTFIATVLQGPYTRPLKWCCLQDCRDSQPSF